MVRLRSRIMYYVYESPHTVLMLEEITACMYSICSKSKSPRPLTTHTHKTGTFFFFNAADMLFANICFKFFEHIRSVKLVLVDWREGAKKSWFNAGREVKRSDQLGKLLYVR